MRKCEYIKFQMQLRKNGMTFFPPYVKNVNRDVDVVSNKFQELVIQRHWKPITLSIAKSKVHKT